MDLNALLGILDDTVSLLEPSSQTGHQSTMSTPYQSPSTTQVISPSPKTGRNVRAVEASATSQASSSSYKSTLSRMSLEDEALILSKQRKRPVKYLRLCDTVPDFDVKLVLRRLTKIVINEK